MGLLQRQSEYTRRSLPCRRDMSRKSGYWVFATRRTVGAQSQRRWHHAVACASSVLPRAQRGRRGNSKRLASDRPAQLRVRYRCGSASGRSPSLGLDQCASSAVKSSSWPRQSCTRRILLDHGIPAEARLSSMTQFVSQFFPLSCEKACSHCAESGPSLSHT